MRTIKSFSQALAYLEAHGVTVVLHGWQMGTGALMWTVDGLLCTKDEVIRTAQQRQAAAQDAIRRERGL